MRSERKLAANRFWFFAAISIILLQTIACSSAQGTSTATAVPQPTSPPQENTATPPPSPELQINGEQILQESIAAVNELEAYKMSMVIGGDFGEGNADCNILSEDNQWLCQHNVVLASGEKDQSLLYQSANNSWYKEDPSEIPWFFVSEGFKVGYSGVNDYALIKQIIETEETIFESQPAIHIHYDFEPERFLSLMLNNLTAVPAYINQANEITIKGNSYIDPDTKLPIKEDLIVAIESNITPLHLTYELTYDFITPVEIEKPVGEDLLEISNQFFTALADERYDTAYSYFATLAKEQITVDDLATLVETNKELFTDFQQLRLLQFDNAPEIPNLDGEFILMLVEAQFTDGSTQQFRLLFIKEDQNWLLGRFDAAVSTNG